MVNKSVYSMIEPYAGFRSDGNGGIFMKIKVNADPEKRDFYVVELDFTDGDRSSATNYRVNDAVLYPSNKKRGENPRRIPISAVGAALRGKSTTIKELLQKYLNKS